MPERLVMRFILLSVLLSVRVAAAQPVDPPPTEPAPPVESPPAPVDPPPVTPPPPQAIPPRTDTPAGRLTVTAERAAMHGDCTAVEAIGSRVRQMDPAYYASAFLTNPIITGCRQGVRLDGTQAGRVTGKPVELAQSGPRFESTSEIAIGGGAWSLLGESIYGPGGPSFGTGKFLNPNLAITLRVAGATHIGDDFAGYLGTIGPHAQIWVSNQLWFGAGVGLGVLAACGGDTCAADTGFGVDGRVGYAFAPRGYSGANVSFEVTSLSAGPLSVATFSLLLGYQTF